MTTRITQLDNGLTVATDSMAGVETVSLGAWVGVGTRHEPAEVNGVAHLLEHMNFKGTERRSASDIAEEIENVGGHLNAYTGRESTAYYARVLSEDMPLALDIVSDILLKSRFDEDELRRERSVVLQEIGQAIDTPDDIIFDHFQEIAYPGQGLGRPVLGRAEIVRGLPRQALLDYMGPRYGAERIIVAAAGAVEHDRFVSLAAEAFGSLKQHSLAESDTPDYTGGEFREERDLEQAHVILGFEAVGFGHPDYYAGQVFSTLFGGGMSSRLFQEVREKRGLVYSIFSFLSSHSDSGLFGVYAASGEAEAGELLPVICEQFGEVGVKGLQGAELDRAKAQLKASILMSRERSSSRCESLANQLLVHGRVLDTSEIVERIEAVDGEAVERFARGLLDSPPTLASLGKIAPVERLDSVAARLGTAGLGTAGLGTSASGAAVRGAG